MLGDLGDRFANRLEIVSGVAFDPRREFARNLFGFFMENVGHLGAKGGKERLYIFPRRFFEVLMELHQRFARSGGMRSGRTFQILDGPG